MLRVFSGNLFPGFTASLLFIVIFEIYLKMRNEKVDWRHRLLMLIMGIYLTAIFSMTLVPWSQASFHMFGRNINLVPFHVLSTIDENPFNLWGNIIMFVPFGTILVLLSRKCGRLLVTVPMGAGLSVFIELLQLFGFRITDIDDVILNTTGALIGFIIGKLILRNSASLRKAAGIVKLVDGKLFRRQNDVVNIVFLVLLVFGSTFFQGNLNADAAKERPMPPEPPAAPAPVIKTISAEVSARNAYLWDLNSNTVLYDKESDQKIAPASTAKMLTALTALDYCDQDDEVVVGEEVHRIASDASRAWLDPGARLTVRQLLDALLLPSGNDAAYSLAVFSGRKLCGDEDASIDKALDAFISAMNEKAEDLGASDSWFVTPDGYDAEGQYTTAHDLACIARGFLKSDLLSEIAESRSISDTWLSGQEVTYDNTNELIDPGSQYFYEYATGLKTGKSEAAGCCLVSSAQIGKKRYLCVVMGSTEEGRWTDSLKLYRSITEE